MKGRYRQASLFEQGLRLEDSIELTLASLREHGGRFHHWAAAFSGGKDSTTAVTVTAWAIASGYVPAPETFTILMSNTRQEIPPLFHQAMQILDTLNKMGFETQIVEPPLEDRFYCYILGRGVPPPKNKFRWCTVKLKITPMMGAVRELSEKYGEKILMITGVRRGESPARDRSIAAVCSRDDGECGLGMWIEPKESDPWGVLAPLLHWRTCHIWDWLMFLAPHHGFPTAPIAEIYGEEEVRTGCIGCPLARRDVALENVVRHLPGWSHLAPLLELRSLWDEMRKPQHRLRQPGTQRLKDGSIPRNPMRMGPLTMEARQHFLERVLDIQRRARHVLITEEDEAYIRRCWEENVWPQGWTGEEPRADALLPQVTQTGAVQWVLSGLQ